ncbi:MAG: hypothetical protein IJ660_07745, partial [Alphaproteobacteria bacterium]|nr:hypothetical protein [Alphaproteobacteria bacterium]
NGQCTVAPKARDKDNGNNSTLNCHIGDIYYSDDTCSPDVISGKTAIGIVYNTQYKLVMALEPEDTGKYYTGRWTTDYEYLPGKVGLDVDWDSFTDVADISNATSRIDAYKDMDGQHHTQVLAPEKGKVGIYGSEDAPHHCRNKTTADKEWYLPAAGEVVNWGLYYSEIDKGFKKLSKRLFPNNWTTVIWTSSEQNDAQAWGFEFSSLGRPRLEAFNKSDGHGVWCIFSYGQKDGNYVPPEVPCASGAFYYSDNTCGVELTKHKTLVGFVYDADQGLVISVEPKDLPWNDGSSEWSLVPNMTDTSHMTDTSNGEENTNKIVEFATSNGQEHKAAQYCHDMKVGGKTWFLPAKKEFSKYTSDYSTIYLSEIFLEGKGLARSCWLSNQGDKQYAFYVEDNWEDDASRPAKRTGFPLQQKNGMGYFHATPNLYPEAGYYSAGIKACCMTKFKTSNVQIPTQDKPTCSNEMKQAANAEGFIFTEEEKNNLLSKKPAGCNRECIKYGNSSCNLYSCYDYQVEFIPLASLTPTDCSNGGQYCGGANFKYDYQATADKLVAERGNGWRRPSYTEANKYSKIMMSSHPHDIIVPAEDGQRTLRGTTLMQGKVMDGGNIVSDTNDFPSAYMTYIVLMRDKDLTQNDKADICHLK